MACRGWFKLLTKTLTLGACATPFLKVHCQSQNEEVRQFQFSELTAEKLSFDYMMKQSALDSVNNVSKMLTITYTAVEVSSKEYRELLIMLINLTRESFMFNVGDEHWDAILKTRSKLQDKKRIVTELTNHLDHIQKMAVATTDICYSVGMENLSNSLIERIDDAVNKVQTELKMNVQLESEYTDIQEQAIEKHKNNNNCEESNAEETDFQIPET